MLLGEKSFIVTVALLILASLRQAQIINFQMVTNAKTNACLTEWFGSDETLAISFNMDEHLTSVLRKIKKNKAAQEKAVTHLANNISIKILGNDDVQLREFSNAVSGSFTHVTEEYQVIKICVYNSVKNPVIIGGIRTNFRLPNLDGGGQRR